MTRYQRRKLINAINMTASMVVTLIGLAFLTWILTILVIKGGQHINWSVFTEITPGPGSSGGLANAIIGSLLLTVFGILIGTPVGVMAGTYLSEFGRHNRFSAVVRFVNDVLLSAPSIVIGVFVYVVLVEPVGHFSGWAGAVALAIIVIPVVVRTTETMLTLVPAQMREAAAALGAPQHVIVTKIVFKAAMSGMVTGVILATARIAGETAPLLFTALNNQFWTTNMNEPMANLPVVIFQYAMSPYDDWINLAWAGALLITLSVLILNISARLLLRGSKH